MKKLSLVLVLSLLVPIAAQAASVVPRVFSSTAGAQAGFVQRFTPKGFKNAQVETGTVEFGKAPRMRWTYTRPEAKTFVFDGFTTWLYVPADRQVTEHRISENERRDLPFLMLTDAGGVARLFKVTESRSGSEIRSKLIPKGNSILREIIVVSGAADQQLHRLEYTDREGNRTIFEFSNLTRVNSPDSRFTFTVPSGVQVIKN